MGAILSHEINRSKVIFQFFWIILHLAVFGYGWWLQAVDDRLAILNLLKYSVWSSRGAGLCLGLDGFLLFLPGQSFPSTSSLSTMISQHASSKNFCDVVTFSLLMMIIKFMSSQY